MVNIEMIPINLIDVFFEHKKNGKTKIMQIARSLVFHLKPVGGFRIEDIKLLSNSEKFTGSLPNISEMEEYDEIGILKVVNDSIIAIAISINTTGVSI